MRYCTYCDAEVADEAMYCSRCGNHVEKILPIDTADQGKRYCTYCGAEVAQEAMYCSRCGNHVEKILPIDTVDQGKKYCKHCGAEVAKEALYCVQCGGSLETILPANAGRTERTVSAKNTVSTASAASAVGTPSIDQTERILTAEALEKYNAENPSTKESKLQIAARVLLLFGCSIRSYLLLKTELMETMLVIAFCISITIVVYEKLRRGEPISIVLKICTLVAASIPAGIYLFCMPDTTEQPKTRRLKTDRNGLLFVLLSIVTLGMYGVVILADISDDINTIATQQDKKHTMYFCWIWFLLGWLTCGIMTYIWYHGISNRIGKELERRGIEYQISAKTFWGWGVLGGLIIVGQFVYLYKLLQSMNLLCADFNLNG